MSLELPICAFDAKTGILCAVCDAKAKRGQISQADVEISRALISLASRFPGLQSVSFVRGHKVQGNYFIQVGKSGLVALRDRDLRSELERILGGRLWVADASSTERQLVEDIVYPMRVVGFGTIWLPDGSRLARITVGWAAGRKQAERLEIAKKILAEVRGIDLVVEFDHAALGAVEEAPQITRYH